jgi:hypothetical protein
MRKEGERREVLGQHEQHCDVAVDGEQAHALKEVATPDLCNSFCALYLQSKEAVRAALRAPSAVVQRCLCRPLLSLQ